MPPAAAVRFFRKMTLREWFVMYRITPVLFTIPDWRAKENQNPSGYITVQAYRSDTAPNIRADGIIHICKPGGAPLAHDEVEKHMDATFMEYNRSLGWFDLRLTDW